MKSCHLDNMDGLKGYYTIWNKSDKKTDTVCFHLYVEPKIQNKEQI